MFSKSMPADIISLMQVSGMGVWVAVWGWGWGVSVGLWVAMCGGVSVGVG